MFELTHDCQNQVSHCNFCKTYTSKVLQDHSANLISINSSLIWTYTKLSNENNGINNRVLH